MFAFAGRKRRSGNGTGTIPRHEHHARMVHTPPYLTPANKGSASFSPPHGVRHGCHRGMTSCLSPACTLCALLLQEKVCT